MVEYWPSSFRVFHLTLTPTLKNANKNNNRRDFENDLIKKLNAKRFLKYIYLRLFLLSRGSHIIIKVITRDHGLTWFSGRM